MIFPISAKSVMLLYDPENRSHDKNAKMGRKSLGRVETNFCLLFGMISRRTRPATSPIQNGTYGRAISHFSCKPTFATFRSRVST
jgi:hypothetical protein